MDKGTFLAAVEAAGVVGEGGAGFPAHAKYAATAETVIANGCECEPLLHTDRHLMIHHADAVVAGLDLLGEAVGANRRVLAVKRKQVEAIAILRAAIGARAIELALLDDCYPAGDEQILTREVTGRSVPPQGIPLAVGVVVANVGTLVSAVAATEGRPVVAKTFTVTGDVARPGVVTAPLGTPLADCLAAAGGATLDDPIFVVGGPMMGRVVDDPAKFAAEVVTKTTGGLIALPRGHHLHLNATLGVDHMRARAEAACIQCRLCSDLCPRQLIGHPFETHRVMRAFASGRELEPGDGRQALLCCDCGVCEHFACPMGLAPRRINQAVKRALRAGDLKYEGSREIEDARTEWREPRRVPVRRLADRIGIGAYMDLPEHDLGRLAPTRVAVPLSQHIGRPAEPLVAVGDRVRVGDPIGAIPKGALGARIHASIDGRVESVGAAIVLAAV
ncbi:MAG: propanediol utilization protein [Phyllobacteriaceae bacterium]|nr:propanediol utilization protein [Phyllobacteriaceae bacterium]